MLVVFSTTTNSKRYGRNNHNRYFKDWANAQKEMDKQVETLVKDGARIVRTLDRMNVDKGFYEYQKDLQFKEENGEVYEMSLSVYDAYFED